MKELIILMTVMSFGIFTSAKNEEHKNSRLLNVADVRAYASKVYCILSKDKLSLEKGLYIIR